MGILRLSGMKAFLIKTGAPNVRVSMSSEMTAWTRPPLAMVAD